MPSDFLFKKIQTLQGENSHQQATLYKSKEVPKCSLFNAETICGPSLSFNDIVNTDAALALIREFPKEEGVTAVLYHHGNPCGVAVADNSKAAIMKAIEVSDVTSIIEGVLVTNDVIDLPLAVCINDLILSVVVAQDFTKEAINLLQDKQHLTVLKHPQMMEPLPPSTQEIQTIVGGGLVQDYNIALIEKLVTVTSREATEQELKQLMLAWKVVKHTKSNAIVLVRDNATVGIGPGANNRIWSTQQAVIRAGAKAKGSVLASDSIIPLCESVRIAGQAGVTAIVEPGGWYKEDENVQVAEKYNMAIITTGVNHFKH